MIEELIQAGHLRQFVQGSRGSKRSPPRREEIVERRDYTPRWTREDDHRLEHRPRQEEPPRKEGGGGKGGREVINTIVGASLGEVAPTRQERSI